MDRYIFDEWQPNLWMLFGSLFLFAYLVWEAESIKETILLLLTYLFLGWSTSFSKPIKKEPKKGVVLK